MPPHDSGASVVRYTFTARDFHSLLFAGFAGALITDFITNACLPPIKLMNGRGAGEKGSGAHSQNGGPGRADPCRKRRSASRVSCLACLVMRAFVGAHQAASTQRTGIRRQMGPDCLLLYRLLYRRWFRSALWSAHD